MNKFLVTGAAGFIGFHLCRRLLEEGRQVTGVDNLNPYYDVRLKEDRLHLLEEDGGFSFSRTDLSDKQAMEKLFEKIRPEIVVNLAAQPGVRYSIANPYAYLDSNVIGFLNVLEGCRRQSVKHLIFASSSSVYGANTKMPYSVHDNVDHPLSLYAATKKSNELMAHAYSSLYAIPCTGLRFFTVYGPWGRPDMAYFLFTKAIMEGKPIDVFNNGKMMRDFTYVDDIIEGLARLLEKIPAPDASWRESPPDAAKSLAPYRLYNIGNNKPVSLMEFIEALENHTGRKAIRNYLPMQAGDVVATFADVGDLIEEAGFKPQTSIHEGLGRFVAWYRTYYRILSPAKAG